MALDPRHLADQLASSGALLVQQLSGLDGETLRFKPSPDKWSMLEVLVHLWDEEQLDFKPRLRSTLEDPRRPWPAIDPQGWAVEKRYNEQDPGQALAGFEHERAASVAWLRGLVDPAWDNTYQHPALGPLRAGDLMMAWLAHDHLHVRQLANLQITKVACQGAPYSIRYALP